MKKLSFLVLSLMAVMMFTACNNEEEPINKTTLNAVINSRAINGDKVIFSQNSSVSEINLTDMTIQISSGYKDCNGAGHTLTTPAMKLNAVGVMLYQFNGGTTSSGTVTNLTGYIDLNTLSIWYSFTANGTDQIISTTQPIYSYGYTTITNPENGNHYTHTSSQYMFAFNETGEKCTMVVTNFAPNLNGSIQVNQIYWENLTVTPTTTGYTITSSKAESHIKDTHVITDLSITLDYQCQNVNGSFKCDDLDFMITSSMFPTAELY